MPDFSLGEKLRVTLFGQSHGPAVGCVIEGYPAGRRIDREAAAAFLARRAPGRNAWSTPRRETDDFEFVSGLDGDGMTCGAPLTALIRNADAHSGDYPDLRRVPRPGHADYAAGCKYGGAWDYRGGGHFSARLTAPLCLAGALCLPLLAEKGIRVAAHVARIGGVEDVSPDPVAPVLPLYPEGAFPAIDPARGEEMQREIERARQAGDSVDGAVRCIVTGLLPGQAGGPYFGGLEGLLARAIFAIPAAKGLSFGDTRHRGSENNDPYCIRNGAVAAASNHAGGILGGITTGLPVYFTVSFKPTPSIALPQRTVDLQAGEETVLALGGRHDPCVAPRAVPVVEAVTALTLADLLLEGVKTHG